MHHNHCSQRRALVSFNWAFSKSFHYVINLIKGIPKNGSVPTFSRSRKTSENSGRFQPSLNPIKSSSRGDLENGDVRKLKRHSDGSHGSKYSDEFVSINWQKIILNFFYLLLYCFKLFMNLLYLCMTLFTKTIYTRDFYWHSKFELFSLLTKYLCFQFRNSRQSLR